MLSRWCPPASEAVFDRSWSGRSTVTVAEYLVRFDEPIGDACGIEARVPSRHGSFYIYEPAAWLIDCNLEAIEALTDVHLAAP